MLGGVSVYVTWRGLGQADISELAASLLEMLQAMFLRNPTFIPLGGKTGFTPLGGISDKLIFQIETSQVTSLRQPAFIPLGGLR